jgi:hypothetical protein
MLRSEVSVAFYQITVYMYSYLMIDKFEDVTFELWPTGSWTRFNRASCSGSAKKVHPLEVSICDFKMLFISQLLAHVFIGLQADFMGKDVVLRLKNG